MAAESEDILVNGCIEWDRYSQNKLYMTYSSKMFTVCFRYSSTREEAEDTLHEGFMKVFNNIKSYKKEGSLEGWIRKIMVNTAIRKFRNNSNLIPIVRIEDYKRPLNNYYTDEILSQLCAKELMQMVQKLPPRCRMIFNLYVFEGFKHKEIAEKLGINTGTSKSTLFDARAILQKSLNQTMRIVKPTMDVGRQ